MKLFISDATHRVTGENVIVIEIVEMEGPVKGFSFPLSPDEALSVRDMIGKAVAACERKALERVQ